MSDVRGIKMNFNKKTFIIGIFILFIFTSCQTNDEQTNGDLPANNEEEQSTQEESDPLVLPNKHLQKGDSGEEVKQLQHVLNEIGYEVNISRVFDKLTTWAITDIQLQLDEDNVTGIYTNETKQMIENIIANEQAITVSAKLAKPENPHKLLETVENPYDILVLVNKTYALPDHFEPVDLTVPNVRFPFDEDDPKKQLRQVAANALEAMFAQADQDGVELYAQSGYRSFQRQEAIFAANVERHGEEKANTYSARPGESEHQTGLVMDVTSRAIGFTLEVDFANTKEGQWIKDHAHEYGFIIRYPEGKEAITQYQYEPWHLRYVGEKAAIEITENNLTLEEYLTED